MGSDRSGDRTHDLKIKSLLLYQLSYPVATRGVMPARPGVTHEDTTPEPEEAPWLARLPREA